MARAARSASRVADTSQELGSLLARAGRFEEAHALLAEAREEYERAGDDGEVLLTDARHAECLVLEGKAKAARRVANAALRRAEAVGDVFGSKAVLYRARMRAPAARAAGEGAARPRGEPRRRAPERAQYDIALALDALVALERLAGEPTEPIEQEIDAIVGSLNIVSVPSIPLSQETWPPARDGQVVRGVSCVGLAEAALLVPRVRDAEGDDQVAGVVLHLGEDAGEQSRAGLVGQFFTLLW